MVSVHTPAFNVPWKHLHGVDVSAIRLKNNPKLWFTEIELGRSDPLSSSAR